MRRRSRRLAARRAIPWVPLPRRLRRPSWSVGCTEESEAGGMWKATVRGIVARKVRLALTVVAVLLGVSFVSGTDVLTDTLNQSFQGVFRQTLAGVNLVVQRTAPFGGGGSADRERFPERVVNTARTVPGVKDAVGFVQGYAQFVDRAGHAIQSTGAPTIGLAWAQRGSRGPLRLLADGRRPSRPPQHAGDVAMDLGTAHRYGYHVGHLAALLLPAPKTPFRTLPLFRLCNLSALSPVTPTT